VIKREQPNAWKRAWVRALPDFAGEFLSAGGAMDISRRWSEAQAPEARSH
jgi:hypothetical protein